MIKPVLLAAIMACTTAAHAQVSIWGPSAPAQDKPAVVAPAPAPVSPYVRPLPEAKPEPAFPQATPTPAPEMAPVPAPQPPKWSLKDVPDDPEPMVYPGSQKGTDQARPPVVMDKADTLKAINDPEKRKELEKYSQNGKLVFPQNPPEMNENTAKILPSPQIPVQDIPVEVPDLFDECPTNDCPEEI